MLVDLSDCHEIVNYLIHDGKDIHDRKGVEARNMKCPTCKGSQGYLCTHQGAIAWFCANYTCLQDSAEKSKKISRQEWEKKFGSFAQANGTR